MALIFCRKNFMGGKTVVRELIPQVDDKGKPVTEKIPEKDEHGQFVYEGVELVNEKGEKVSSKRQKMKDTGKPIVKLVTYRFTRNDLGKEFSFHDEAKILKEYPLLFKKKA